MDPVYLDCFACGCVFNAISLPPSCFILQCMHFRCKNCTDHQNPCRLDHTAFPLQISDSQVSSFLSSCSLPTGICSSHNLPQECFCKTCYSLICYRCIILHKSHEICDETQLQEVAQELKSTLMQEFYSKLQISNTHNSRIRQIKSSLNDIKRSIKTVNEQLAIEMKEIENKFEARIDEEFKFFLKINARNLEKCQRVWQECLVLKEVVEKGNQFLIEKNEMIGKMEGNVQVLLEKKAFEVEDVRFDGIPYYLQSLVYYRDDSKSRLLEEFRWMLSCCK